jgi:S-adenosylmethionine hydrolase
MQRTEHRPVIGFLTDFGLDGAAATCRGVMLSICPDAQIVDIGHTTRKYAVRDGAYILRTALPYFPIGVHVAVVDPGVGTARRPIGISTARGDVLVGPDNGLLRPAAEVLGGPVDVRELTNRELWLPGVSSTFHGRDIFSPVAAHLAAGHVAFSAVGPSLAVTDLTHLPDADVRARRGVLHTEVEYVDSFGNVRLGGGHPDLHDAFGDLEPGDGFVVVIAGAQAERIDVTFAPSFGHVGEGEGVLYLDSSRQIAVGANQDDLAGRTGIAAGMAARIERA